MDFLDDHDQRVLTGLNHVEGGDDLPLHTQFKVTFSYALICMASKLTDTLSFRFMLSRVRY